MITFYVNGCTDVINNDIRRCRNKYITPQLEPYGVESKVVIFNKDNLLDKKFLIKILSKQAEGHGISAITRKGMFDRNSSTLSRLAKYDRQAIRDWKLMLIDKENPLTTNKVIDWLLEHPVFINTIFMYDDEADIYYTNQISLGCEIARNRKVKEVRKKVNYERILHLEASISDEHVELKESKHNDYWADQEREFEDEEIWN